MTALRAERLTVRYGEQLALDQVSFVLEPGVTGLLGANGAGKSTLIRVLATLQHPVSGTLYWGEHDVVRQPQRLRRTLGYVPQEVGAYPTLTPTEFLQYIAAVKGLPVRSSDRQVPVLLEELNLSAQARRPLGSCSGGMRQRVAIAQALLGEPELIIFDEPTVGLDPEERARFQALIRQLGERRIILLATHITSDLTACARDALVLQSGRVAYHGSLAGVFPGSGDPGQDDLSAALRAAATRAAEPTERDSPARRAAWAVKPHG